MTHKEDKGEAPKVQRSPISEVTCSTQSLPIGELEIEIYEVDPSLVDEYVEEEPEPEPEPIGDYDNVDAYEAEVNLLDEYIGKLEKNDSEPIEPLVEFIEEINQAKDSLGIEKKIESSDQLGVVKSDLNPVTIEESEKVLSEGITIWVLTVKKFPDQSVKEHPQEVVKVLKDFNDNLPYHLSSLRNIPIPSRPSWDIYHIIDLVPVIFNNYFQKTL